MAALVLLERRLELFQVFLRNQKANLTVCGLVQGLQLLSVTPVSQLLEVLLDCKVWRTGSLLVFFNKTRKLIDSNDCNLLFDSLNQFGFSFSQ